MRVALSPRIQRRLTEVEAIARQAEAAEAAALRAPEPELTDDTIVFFDGEQCRFGELMLADRHTVEYDAERGVFFGGYPF